MRTTHLALMLCYCFRVYAAPQEASRPTPNSASEIRIRIIRVPSPRLSTAPLWDSSKSETACITAQTDALIATESRSPVGRRTGAISEPEICQEGIVAKLTPDTEVELLDPVERCGKSQHVIVKTGKHVGTVGCIAQGYLREPDTKGEE